MGESLTRSALGSASNSMSWLSETLRCVLNPLRFSSGYSGLLCSPQSCCSFCGKEDGPKAPRATTAAPPPIVAQSRPSRSIGNPCSG